MRLTFKKNCADIRNSGVTNMILELHKKTYDAIILAADHNKFKKLGINLINYLKKIQYFTI